MARIGPGRARPAPSVPSFRPAGWPTMELDMRRTIRKAVLPTALLGAAFLCAAAGAAASSRIVFSDMRRIEAIAPDGGGRHAIARAPRKTADIAATDDGRWVAILSNRGAPGPSPRAVHTD